MVEPSEQTSPGACPFVECNDLRCGSRFSLSRIDQAFGVCFDAYHTCPMYHLIRSERDQTPPVTVTIHASDEPLRATGT